jgi:hypothetical protein
MVLWLLGCAMAWPAMFTGTALAAVQPGCSQSGPTVTCTYTSGDNAFTVPAGVSSLHIVAVGAPGQDEGGSGYGGLGAQVSGDLAVTPKSTLYAVVGGYGGANGGGQGAICYDHVVPLGRAGAGGGASDVRAIDTDLTSRLLVAGGGGGTGCFGFQLDGATGGRISTGLGGNGGTAGAPGAPGAPGFGNSCASDPACPSTGVPEGLTPGLGGLPGTEINGGAGGAGGQAASACTSTCGQGAPGGAGSQGIGGDGGAGEAPNSCYPSDPNGYQYGGGGGGGGGLFGGGGGGGGARINCADESGGGGGGGGSSLVPPGGSLSIDTTGQPEIVISYTH